VYAEIIAVVVSIFVLAPVVVLVLAVRKPDAFRYVRTTRIAAPAERVFRQLDDFRAWANWSPWDAMDPTMQRTYAGAERGVGATYAWKGNKKVGEGRMEIIESAPPTSLRIRLVFIAPFPADNVAIFTLTPDGDGTRLEWAMEGKNTFGGKVFAVFADMDALLGKDFEKGLAGIKRLAEAG
jgi:uncharacterized protein YndB with AHSA1/START domain